MTPFDIVEKNVSSFLSAIEPVKEVYQCDSFSYVAVENEDNGYVLIQGTLYLNVNKPGIPFKAFQSDGIRAEHFRLADIDRTREQFIADIRTGKIKTPKGEICFQPSAGGNNYGTTFDAYHEVGLRTQSRLTHLSLSGAELHTLFDRDRLDWKLRACETPYDGLNDLLNEFQPGLLRRSSCVEFGTFSVAYIDSESVVSGEVAQLAVRVSPHADIKKVTVGVRVLEQGRVIDRRQLSGAKFTWKEVDGIKRGSIEFPVPRAAVVHAIACYNGVAQQYYSFGDPNSFQNPRRAAYEAFDPKMASFYDILAKSIETRPDSKSFEAAMPWLFWMLGFGPAHIGGLPRTSDSADFLVATPKGHLAVVECTVGLLKDDDKLPKLHDRVQAVRRNLDASNMRHVHILPVIITAKTAEEVRPDMEQARKLRILVVTRERIDELLLRTLVTANADQLYAEAEQTVEVWSEKTDAHGNLEIEEGEDDEIE